ncbi:hypothetical protein B0T24DRAFT_531458 [Lasiosphaeria ovina]|uniref:ATPase AAA-type core domain-containing protein n=1 Tax=Lasiosphaeria ovina TaxID=92902 RepID=A0AAE0K996_9PEZI|nr:hypothetical protein B0T24DRAFT_531458 [Lasiosphaeria ovina]
MERLHRKQTRRARQARASSPDSDIRLHIARAEEIRIDESEHRRNLREQEEERDPEATRVVEASSTSVTNSPHFIVIEPHTVVEPEVILGPLPTHASPSLNRVEWILFKGLVSRDEKDSNAIDVLIGDPVLTWDNWDPYAQYSRRMGRPGDGAVIADRKIPAPKQPLRPGQALLPERIRIHSSQLLQVLAKIHGSNFVNTIYSHSCVLIRPFKVLAYYETRLRDWYNKLQAKQAAEDGAVDEEMKEEEKEEEDPNDDTTSPTALNHLRCLIQFMDTDIAQKMAYLNSRECRKVAFADLWHLFQPGIDVIGIDGKQAYRVMSSSTKSDETPITLNCSYLDFDGKLLGPVARSFEIKRFDDLREVTSLPVFPLRFHPMDKLAPAKKAPEGAEAPTVPTAPGDRLRQYLVARGKKFLRAAAMEHMYYDGPALETKDEIESQVVVDFQTAFSLEEHVKQNWKPTLENLISAEPPAPESPPLCKWECCRGENIHDDMYVDTKRNSEYLESLFPKARDMPIPVSIFPRPLKETNKGEFALDDSDMVIMSYRAFGFVLRSRKWAKLDLTYLNEIKETSGATKSPEAVVEGSEEWENTAFGRLVLPDGHKKMVLSLTAQHFRDKDPSRGQNEQVDIVRGKGRALVPFGERPVSRNTSLTLCDLGSTAKEVEKSLETNFALANKWGCILLLDEADVFLASRTKADFIRNGLVAVFLRVLEYYAGILFLTTNRIGDFDEAFASRIHISLYYPPLDREKTLEVFTLNLKLIQERIEKQDREIRIDWVKIGSFAGEYWDKYKSARWNGRQIRNACQTALALAEFKAQGDSHTGPVNTGAVIMLDVSHLEVVFKAYRKFKSYLKRVHGVDEDRRANEAELRALDDLSGDNTDSDDEKGAHAASKKKNALRAMKKNRKEKGQDPAGQPAISPQQPFPGPAANPGLSTPMNSYVSYANPSPAQPAYPYAPVVQYTQPAPPSQPVNPQGGPAGYQISPEAQNPQQLAPPQAWATYGTAPPASYPPQPGQGPHGGAHLSG